MQSILNHCIEVAGWGWQVPAWGRQPLTLGLSRTQLLLFHPWEAATEAAQTQLSREEELNSVLLSHSWPSAGQGSDLCCELGWGAAAFQGCVHSGEQLHFSFLIYCVVWEENILLYTRGTLA